MNKRQHSRALDLIEELVGLTEGQDRDIAIELRNRLMLPMTAIIERIPGGSMRGKAKAAEISRQTLYTWKRNETRPSLKQAMKLATLTKLPWDRIVGRRS